MKTLILAGVLMVTMNWCWAGEFLRDLPGENLCKALTPENFKNMDAVIILKEQSLHIQDAEIEYRGITIKGPSTTHVKVLIVKLFNASAVKRYGTFEYNYREYFGDDIPHLFEARARVLKADGKVWVMPKKEIQKIVSLKASDGTTLARKIIFKVPNLTAGDILQIEYQFEERLARSVSGIFFYNDRDIVLFSNLLITFPMKEEVKYLSFPAVKIGEPKVEQISKRFGAGKTYCWLLKNLNAIPDEPYSLPFSDQSLMTAFIVEKIDQVYIGDWENLAKEFYRNYLAKDRIKKFRVEELGFTGEAGLEMTSIDQVDRLYTALRKKIILTESNSLFPESEDIDKVFKSGKGDASDLAYIMFRILKDEYQQHVNIVWIRDQREGIYEKTVPTTRWFDRLGVLVNLAGQEKLYDFDRCIPCNYVHPSFLKSNEVVVLSEPGCSHKTIKIPSVTQDNLYSETQTLNFDNKLMLHDSVSICYQGFPAEKFRGKYYDITEDEIQNNIKESVANSFVTNVDSLYLNNFYDEGEVKISITGVYKAKSERVENLLTFRLSNNILDDFKNNIFTAGRRSDIYFDGPFQIDLNWLISIPDGYELDSQFENHSSGLEGKITLAIYYEVDKKLKISAQLKFQDRYLPLHLYAKLISLLDEMLKQINKDIILKKI